MYSTHDRSNAANVANFDTLLTYIGGIGPRYNPGLDKLKLTYLTSRLESTKLIMTAFDNALATDQDARNRRRLLFDKLAPLAVRAVRMFSLCDVNELSINAAKSLVKKIQGKKITAVGETETDTATEDNEPETEGSEPPAEEAEGQPENDEGDHVHHEASQKSFTFLVQHLSQLISIITKATDYTPNEPELKLTALQALLQEMKDANHETNTTATALEVARLNRDRTLYRNGDGIVKLAKAVKKYVSIAFGTTSPQYETVNSIIFTDYPFTELDETLPDPS